MDDIPEFEELESMISEVGMKMESAKRAHQHALQLNLSTHSIICEYLEKYQQEFLQLRAMAEIRIQYDELKGNNLKENDLTRLQ